MKRIIITFLIFGFVLFLVLTANTLLILIGALAGISALIYIVLRQSKIVGKDVTA